MKTCPKCNNVVSDDARFCDKCGTLLERAVENTETILEKTILADSILPVEEPVIEEPVVEESLVEEPAAEEPAVQVEAQPTEEPAAVKKFVMPKLSPKMIGIAAVAVVAVVAVFLISSIFSGGEKENYSFYLKDGEMYFTEYKKDKEFEVTSHLFDDVDNEYMYTSAGQIANYTALSEDGKRVFFPDKYNEYDNGVTLYYREVNKPKKDAEKIDSEVTSYVINENGSEIVYLQGYDGTLYWSNLKKEEKIDKDVRWFDVTEDFKKIIYLTNDNDLYFGNVGKECEKVVGNIENVYDTSDDFSVIYYVKNDALYRREIKKEDAEKVVSEFSRIIRVYDSGEIYYTKTEEKKINAADYVEDDMAAKDALITGEPEYPDYPDAPRYPSWWSYYGDDEGYEEAVAEYEVLYDEYEKEYVRIREEYQKAYDEYRLKEERDYIREELESMELNRTEYSLYYYNGKEEVVIAEALKDEFDVTSSYDKPIALFEVYEEADVAKIKMSEIESVYDVSYIIENALSFSGKKKIALAETVQDLSQEDVFNYRLSGDGSEIAFLANLSDDGYGDLYTMKIDGKKLGKAELYDSDVSNTSYYYQGAAYRLIYYKDVDYSENTGELYADKEKIGESRLYMTGSTEESIYYYSEYDDSEQSGTLSVYKKGKSEEIAEDVHDYQVITDAELLCLRDYDLDKYEGSLDLYRNGKATNLDEEVCALIPVYSYSSRKRGY